MSVSVSVALALSVALSVSVAVALSVALSVWPGRPGPGEPPAAAIHSLSDQEYVPRYART